VYIDVTYWFVTVPAAIVLLLVGWYGAGWLHRLRWVAYAAAAFLIAPFPVVATVAIVDDILSAANLAAVQRTLDRDETVAGLTLPAGSKIQFTDKTRFGIAAIDLPRATDILGVRLAGTLLWSDVSHDWNGTLDEDQRLDGWPCRAGPVEFDNDGIVQRCELAAAHELLGFTLPPGSVVTRGNGKPWDLRLPENVGLAVSALSTMAPPGVTLSVASSGRLERMSSGHGQTIVVRGAPLNSMNLHVRGDQVVATLAAPFMVAGEMRPAETGVRIDLPTGAISLAAKNWWLSE
jgi:hypothetical protein